MPYYLLQIKDALGPRPTVFIHSSTNITRREGQASSIYNNLLRKQVRDFGKFDPAKDLLLPVDYNTSTERGLHSFGFAVDGLVEEVEEVVGATAGGGEDENGEDTTIGEEILTVICGFPHTGRPYGMFSYRNDDGDAVYNCGECGAAYTLQ
jgi:hypothetical protein